MKKLLISIVIVSFILVAVSVFVDKTQNQAEMSRPKITASFYPLAEFARKVSGGVFEVEDIVPSGIEPHDFEPSPQDIVSLYSTNLFIFNGAGFDTWAEKIVSDLDERNILVINMADHIKPFLDKNLNNENEEEGDIDPHFWLDPNLAQKEVQIIKDALVKIDPKNSMFYEANTEEYVGKLRELDSKYREGLASCASKDIITSHAAFGYLADQYGINVISIAGLAPEEEPSPKRLAEIAEIARSKNIKYIFFETLVSPKLADVIAREIGIGTKILNPIEGLTEEEISSGEDYVSVMEENLVNLREALSCE